MAENRELTHAEIWDDSTLLNTWEAAREEYKKYHSIQARGENVESVLITTKEAGEVEMKDVPSQHMIHAQETEDKPADSTSEEEGEVVTEFVEEPGLQQAGQEQGEVNNRVPELQPMKETGTETGQAPHKLPSPPPFPPSILAGENEALRNLMISWYFAGYYTGLYEGQQKAKGV